MPSIMVSALFRITVVTDIKLLAIAPMIEDALFSTPVYIKNTFKLGNVSSNDSIAFITSFEFPSLNAFM